jgi:tryptophanyl-tRNA synthetase
MSKSYHNIIDIFVSDKELLKQIKTIVTDSTPLEEPKNPTTCNVFKLYELIATTTETATLREKYLAGNFGYGHAKQALYEMLIAKFAKERQIFNEYMQDTTQIEKKLAIGEEKASILARKKMATVREILGFLGNR